jgi:hypothetical protein
MSFSYDLTESVGQVRLALGDTTSGAGVRPDGSNFSDDEIQYFVDQENNLDLAVARACDVLATQWTTVADLQVGPRREALGAIAERYTERAKSLRGATLVTGYISLNFQQVNG